MLKSLPWLLCAVTVFVPPATLLGQSATQTTTQEPIQSTNTDPFLRALSSGVWWNTLSPVSKADFVNGYVSAMAEVHGKLIGFSKLNAKELTPGNPQFDAQMSSIMQLSVLAEHYDFTEVGQTQLLAGMDAFYKEPLNKLIPIEFAFDYERDTLTGKVAPRDLQKQLDGWRATLNK